MSDLAEFPRELINPVFITFWSVVIAVTGFVAPASRF